MEFRPKHTKHKVLLAVYGALFLLCIGVIAFVHQGEQRARQVQGLSQLESITATLSEQIPHGHITALMERYDGRGMIFKNTQDAWYYVLHERLRKAAERNGLEAPLEILVHDTMKQELQVLVTSAETPRFRDPWNGDEALILPHYEAEGHTIPSANGRPELMAFGSIRDVDGHVLGIVFARRSTATVVAAAQTSLFRNIAIALVVFGMAGFLLFRYIGRWLNADEAAHDQVKARNADMTDGMAYAAKIQRALVPSALIYDELFADSFVIDRPKDLVSGDFHWVLRIDDDTCFVAAADCTGHGMPGAMMATVGCSLLNEIVPQHAEKDPAEILRILHARMVAALHQQGKERGAGDGMDVALCRVDRRQSEILFAGAYRPLYWLHQGQLSIINGDRRPVGGGHQTEDRHFTTHRLAYTAGDRIYLFSDGYVDQFGGPERKRFMTSRLADLLVKHQQLPLKEQAVLLDRAFLDWKGAGEQMDDICMLGLAV